MVTVHNNIEDYSFEEKQALELAFKELEPKAQRGTLTLEETRIRVAYTRLKRNENFKISQPTVRAKKIKNESFEDAMNGLTGEKPVKQKRITKQKPLSTQAATLSRASKLFFMKQKGEWLSEDDELFLATALAAPEVL